MVMVLTLPVGARMAVPAAFMPPPPLKVSVGADVYPLPPFVRLRAPTEVGPSVAVAVAVIPPNCGGAMATVGVDR